MALSLKKEYTVLCADGTRFSASDAEVYGRRDATGKQYDGLIWLQFAEWVSKSKKTLRLKRHCTARGLSARVGEALAMGVYSNQEWAHAALADVTR